MPSKQTRPPQHGDAQDLRPIQLPDNPFTTVEARWAEDAFSGLTAQVERTIAEVGHKLSEAWDQGARAGYDQGFQAGSRETERELRAFYEDALTEQEVAATRALAEQAERLRADHAASLAAIEATLRSQFEDEARQRFASEASQLEDRIRRDVEFELQQVFSAELQEVEARVRRDTESAMRAAFDADRPADPSPEERNETLREARAEGYTQGLNESARRYEEAMTRVAFERREAVEAAYQKGFEDAGGQSDKELKSAFQEGYRKGLKEAGKEFASAAAAVPTPLLDEARRQAYENGYEDGRGVGITRGRRQAEAEQAGRLLEATRQAYREGFLDGKRTVADAERSWAFGVLHLPPDASNGEIKQHYKRLSRVLHPDQNPQLADLFIKNLNRARQLLDA